MAPKVYSTDASPPCRAVILTCKALNIDIELIECNTAAGQHLTPEYLKLNPGHTIPTMVDGDLILPNSHAINIYLVENYGKDSSLYPKEGTKRATVNHRLFFDEGTAFPAVLAVGKMIFVDKKPITEAHKEKILESYKITETFLQNQKWIAGDTLTIADFHLVTTITTSMLMVPVSEKDYPNVFAWIARCEALPYFEINRKGLRILKEFLQ